MKDLKDMTAAELVAELEDATSMCMNECNNCGHQQRKNKSELFCNECGTQFVIFHNRKLQTRCTSAPDRLKAGSVTDIIAELDARCSRWGLKIGYDNERTYIGRPQKGEKRVFKDEIIPYVEIGMISDSCYDQDSYGDISGVVSVTIQNPAEFHALLGYLLSKEVKP